MKLKYGDVKIKLFTEIAPKHVERFKTLARENLYDLVERGQDAIDGILQLSKETEHPRAYEVAGQLIKTVGETAENLIDLQQKLKKLEGEDQKIGQQHNHLYVGSTSELQKFLKKNDKKLRLPKIF